MYCSGLHLVLRDAILENMCDYQQAFHVNFFAKNQSGGIRTDQYGESIHYHKVKRAADGAAAQALLLFHKVKK